MLNDAYANTEVLDPLLVDESFDLAMNPMMASLAMPKAQGSAVASAHRSQLPTLTWWGPDFEQSANSAAIALLGDSHAGCLGVSARECWAHVWEALEPLLHQSSANNCTKSWSARNIPVGHEGSDPQHRLELGITPIVDAHRVCGFSIILAARQAISEPTAAVTHRPVMLVDADPGSRAQLTQMLGTARFTLYSFEDIRSVEGAHASLSLIVIGPGSINQAGAIVPLLRRIEPSICLPVLCLGEMAVDVGLHDALTAGADEYLPWPVTETVLHARMEALLAARYRSERALVQADERANNLARALDSNRSIGIALGILMATQKLTADEAFLSLKRVSQRTNRKLREVAEDVIYTGALADLP